MTKEEKKELLELINTKNNSSVNISAQQIVDWVMRIGVLIIVVIIVPMKSQLDDFAKTITKLETREEYRESKENKVEKFMSQDFYTKEDHERNIIPYDNKIQNNATQIKNNSIEIKSNTQELNKIYNEIISLRKDMIENKKELDYLKNK